VATSVGSGRSVEDGLGEDAVSVAPVAGAGGEAVLDDAAVVPAPASVPGDPEQDAREPASRAAATAHAVRRARGRAALIGR
jgi:hypothetical protein